MRCTPQYSTLTLALCLALTVPASRADGARPTDAELLAMQVSDEPFPPGDLVATVEELLTAARAEVPEAEGLGVRLGWDPRSLLVGLPPGRPMATSDPTRTGWPRLDRLNERFEVERIEELGSTYVLHFARAWDVEAVKRRYATVPGIRFAEANHIIGARGGVTLSRRSPAGWRLVFTRGWGDCPSGCIHSRTWKVLLDAGGRVEDVEVSGDELPEGGPASGPPQDLGKGGGPGLFQLPPPVRPGEEASDVRMKSRGRPGR